MYLTNRITLLPLFLIILLANAYPQEKEKQIGWFFEGNISGVWTGGNAVSTTFGLGATVRRVWPMSELRFDAGATQTESGIITRTATGTETSFTVNEDTRKEKTAEIFFSRIRYDYSFSERFYALGGLDWLRNRFAGIDSRFLMALGIGNTWVKEDDIRFKTDYSFTYTFQNDVVENPITNNKFPGFRFTYDFWYKLTESTEFESILIADLNLDNTDDIRIDFLNSLPVKISEIFSLKPTFQFLWRNDPALSEIDLFTAAGTPAGIKVNTPLKNVDTIFSLALVVSL